MMAAAVGMTTHTVMGAEVEVDERRIERGTKGRSMASRGEEEKEVRVTVWGWLREREREVAMLV